MIRIVIENALIFLLPTFTYIAWTAFKLDEWPGLGAVIKAAPLIKLFVAGAFLMLSALASVALREIDHAERPTGASAPPPAVFTPETPTPQKP
ncbi:MAG: hypothetical protein ACKVP4_08980 [Hyphomicrobium sp.]